MTPDSKKLNLGCGRRYHPNWTNIDFVSTGPGVVAHDLRRGVPFPDNTFDVVYHSHVLEHFSRDGAVKFLTECQRVLLPGGIIRIAIPDLEQITRLYLATLENALAREGDGVADLKYEWMKIELYDQTVRQWSGGYHGRTLTLALKSDGEAQDFILGRMGGEAANAKSAFEQARKAEDTAPAQTSTPPPSRGNRLRNLRQLLLSPKRLRESLVYRLLGQEQYNLLELGRFRDSGEIHLWMYDRYSLAKVLRETGFVEPRVRSATESAVPNWSTYNLDTDANGAVYKPDSLYIEAVKAAV